MTNPKEQEWWNDRKYWKNVYLSELGTSLEPKLREIVAEAERRGREAAWEEMKHEIRDALSSFCYVGMPRDGVESARRSGSQGGMNSLADSLRKRIDAKLTELKNL